MATTTKTATVTYTAEQTVDLVAAYSAADTVEKRDAVKAEFAVKFGKGVRSIVAKLVREGVYKKAEYVTKAGEKPQPKNELADAIGAILFLSEPEIDSLTKATKPAMAKYGPKGMGLPLPSFPRTIIEMPMIAPTVEDSSMIKGSILQPIHAPSAASNLKSP